LNNSNEFSKLKVKENKSNRYVYENQMLLRFSSKQRKLKQKLSVKNMKRDKILNNSYVMKDSIKKIKNKRVLINNLINIYNSTNLSKKKFPKTEKENNIFFVSQHQDLKSPIKNIDLRKIDLKSLKYL